MNQNKSSFGVGPIYTPFIRIFIVFTQGLRFVDSLSYYLRLVTCDNIDSTRSSV